MSHPESELLERIERLERVVEGLLERDPKARAALGAGHAPTNVAPAVSPVSPPHPHSPATLPPPPRPRPSVPPRPTEAASLDLRSVLRVVGIALLLFGVAFLFKYSKDESDMMRMMRVVIGIALGSGLVIGGRLLLTRDRPFAQILTGGGIATWFMAGFAAYQLFDLIGDATGFAYMAVVTVLAFVISTRQGSVPLTVVATVGGLATPFLLYDPTRSVVGVSLYVIAVASTAVAIFRKRGWWALLWVAAGGSAYAMFATSMFYFNETTPDDERWLLQIAVLGLYGLFALIAADGYARGVRAGESDEHHDTRLFLITLVPIAAVVMTQTTWTLNQEQIGQLCVTFGLLYLGMTVIVFPREPLRRLTNTYLLLASGFGTVGALALIDGEMQHLAIATEALLLRRFALQSRRVAIADLLARIVRFVRVAGHPRPHGRRIAGDSPLEPYRHHNTVGDRGCDTGGTFATERSGADTPFLFLCGARVDLGVGASSIRVPR